MRRGIAAVWIVVALAVGMLLGIVIVAAVAPNASEAQHEGAAAREVLAGAKGTGAELDWGPLAGLPGRIGPGTHFQQFARALKSGGVWDDGCAIEALDGEARVRFLLTVTGDGKLHVNADYYAWDDARALEVLFRADEVADLPEAKKNLGRVLAALGQGMGLEGAAMSRFRTVVAITPVFYPGEFDAARREALTALPAGVRVAFLREFSKLRIVRGQYDLGEAPILRFRLSDAHLLTLAFCATTILHPNDGVNYHAPGDWWTFSLREAKAGGNGKWPVVKPEEIDAIAAQNRY